MSVLRHAHAPQNLASRRFKGLKIERLLDLVQKREPLRVLEVGTGSGGISHYFGMHPDIECTVDSVDVNDVRSLKDGYRFHLIEGTQLPFPDESFDVVLTNHVIEHVGDKSAQRHHLDEVHRVLKHDGAAYLAVPNRWMLVEPHYKLIFLSWLPHGMRSFYLSLMRNVSFYDCEPLSMAELEQMLRAASFDMKNLCVRALRETLEIECMTGVIASLLRSLPDEVFHFLRPMFPTLIYSLRKIDRHHE